MPGLYLTPADLRDLTGYLNRASVKNRLDRNGWRYPAPGLDGWSRVLRADYVTVLAGGEDKPETHANPRRAYDRRRGREAQNRIGHVTTRQRKRHLGLRLSA